MFDVGWFGVCCFLWFVCWFTLDFGLACVFGYCGLISFGCLGLFCVLDAICLFWFDCLLWDLFVFVAGMRLFMRLFALWLCLVFDVFIGWYVIVLFIIFIVTG